MRFIPKICLVLSLAAVSSCEFVSSFLHDEDVIASVGTHKLYKSALVEAIPAGTPPADSALLAQQFIDRWASDLVFLDMAESQLSKSEKDVEKELEEYRIALLKYRYEQHYIDQRLDSEVSQEEVEAFYDAHKEDYVLRVPIVKARFVKLSADSPSLETIKSLIASDNEEDLALLDTLVYNAADRYNDFGANWVDMPSLAREFGEDYGTLISKMNGSRIEIQDDYGKLYMAYVNEYKRAGTQAPLEFCASDIEDVIISSRKKNLVSTLERDLLEKARRKGDYKVFNK